MSREHFHRLLQRYLDGQCTSEEEQLVQQWYQILDTGNQENLNADDLDAIEDAIWNSIHWEIEQSDISRRPKRIRMWLAVAAAAVLLVASMTFVYFRIICYPVAPSFAGHHAIAEERINIVENYTNKHMRVILPDESLVELYPGAKLEYPKRFKENGREVRLVGNAFFAVAANKENPFWVFHEGMITKVLGTKFTIKAPQAGARGEVIVYSGKVDVYYNAKGRTLVKRILSPPEKASVTTNQKAVLLPKTVKEAVVENPLPVGKQIDMIRHERFKDTPMPALAKTLSALYALDVVADEQLTNITFTGDISGIGLFKQLDIICMVTGTRYEVIGTTIFLKPIN